MTQLTSPEIGGSLFHGRGDLPFPYSNRLIITTTQGVYNWDVYGISQIFRSGSQGIVAAKRVVSGREMLAVADSQVVVLHEVEGGMHKSYRLKGSEVSNLAYTPLDYVD